MQDPYPGLGPPYYARPLSFGGSVAASLLGALIAIPLIIFIMVLAFVGVVAATGLAERPAIGTTHTLAYDRPGYAVVLNPSATSENLRRRWEAVCVLAKGGKMTLSEHLFARRDVGFVKYMTGFNRTGVYIYTPPARAPTMVYGRPWCPEGFQESLPYYVYPPTP